MRLLLDTQIVLWQHGDVGPPLTHAAVAAIRDADELLVSTVTFAEIGVKCAIGKLRVNPDLRTRVVEHGCRLLTLDTEHGLAIAGLPLHHRDPFDRMILAQAQVEQLSILTADAVFTRYDVPVVLT